MHDFQEQCQVYGQRSKNGLLDSLHRPSKKLRNYLKIKYNKTIIRFGFCDIRNNQGQGKCYQPKPITLTSTLIIPDITKTSSNNCLLFEKLKAAGRNCSETRENLTPALEEEEEKVKIL